eukprot:TRINITY_DN3428_c1_g3_i1.p1 TRINITY_DN3428_c1_g3~~TRINITY_DN3428_c1_g3_i1.p1  ORF type:complete len:256 (-),score=64.20 TRINITY_DN3428_c1_g3_i1:56-823(-)
MEPCNEWLLKQQPKMRAFLDALSSIPTTPIDEMPSKIDTLFWGREMATLHFYLRESLPQIKETFPNDNITTSLTNILSELDVEVRSATGRTRLKSRAVPLPFSHSSSSSLTFRSSVGSEGSESKSPTKSASRAKFNLAGSGYNKIFSRDSESGSGREKSARSITPKRDRGIDRAEEESDSLATPKRDKRGEEKRLNSHRTEEEEGAPAVVLKRCMVCEKEIQPEETEVQAWDKKNNLVHSLCVYNFSILLEQPNF